MRKLVLVWVSVFMAGFANNALAQNVSSSDESDKFFLKGRAGLVFTNYCLANDMAPEVALSWGTKEGSLMLSLAGRDTSVFSFGIEKNLLDESAFVGFGLVFGKTFNYQNTDRNYTFARPVGMFGVTVRKFYAASKISLTGGYKEFSFGIRLH